MPGRIPRTPRIPSYRLHKPSGRAVVTLAGRDVYLGAHGSAESRAEYDRVIAEWITSGRTLSATSARQRLTVDALILAFWKHAERYYNPKTLDGNIRPPLRRLRRLYGHTPAADFGPVALKALRETMIQERGRRGGSASRTSVNVQIQWVKSCFRWGVAEGLVPPAVIHGLDAVPGLKRGRSEARETDPVRPVRDEDVEVALPHMPAVVADMVRVQRLTGMRPGELCDLTTGELDTSGEVWLYRLVRHKTAHHGHERVVPIGPHAQAFLRPHLRTELDRPLFSPAESELQRFAQLRKNRQTPLTPSQRRRDAKRTRAAPGGDSKTVTASTATARRSSARATRRGSRDGARTSCGTRGPRSCAASSDSTPPGRCWATPSSNPHRSTRNGPCNRPCGSR